MKFCPLCANPLVPKQYEERQRLSCPDSLCGFVFWDNPIPVVAGIVETAQGVVLAHNTAWPQGMFSVITGYLESGESPQEAIIRETHEELNLTAQRASLVGVYPFAIKNQIIMAYHLEAEGHIRLNHELDEYKLLSKQSIEQWSFSNLALTQQIIADWLDKPICPA